MPLARSGCDGPCHTAQVHRGEPGLTLSRPLLGVTVLCLASFLVMAVIAADAAVLPSRPPRPCLRAAHAASDHGLRDGRSLRAWARDYGVLALITLGVALLWTSQPPLGCRVTAPDGRNRRAPARRQVGRRSPAPESRRLGLSERPRAQPGGVLRPDGLSAVHVDADASPAPARVTRAASAIVRGRRDSVGSTSRRTGCRTWRAGSRWESPTCCPRSVLSRRSGAGAGRARRLRGLRSGRAACRR